MHFIPNHLVRDDISTITVTVMFPVIALCTAQVIEQPDYSPVTEFDSYPCIIGDGAISTFPLYPTFFITHLLTNLPCKYVANTEPMPPPSPMATISHPHPLFAIVAII